MITALVYCYLGGWVLASVLITLTAARLHDRSSPPEHPRLMSIVAGAAWPILIVALAEAGAVALTTELVHEDPHLLSVDA